jgi:hypothetical protein
VLYPSRPCVATGEIHADTQAPRPERIEENDEKRESPSRALDRSAGTESIFEATLSSRSRRGTEIASVFYSLLETAKLLNVDPARYLREAALADCSRPRWLMASRAG